MFDFLDDVFHFLASHAPSLPSAPGHGSSEPDPLEDAAHDAFDMWRDTTNDFFDQLGAATEDWGAPTQDFVSAWQQATESCADQFAHWFGWSSDDSPV